MMQHSLPSSHSDYVFTVTGEEVNWGLVGAVLGLLVMVAVVAYFRLRKRDDL